MYSSFKPLAFVCLVLLMIVACTSIASTTSTKPTPLASETATAVIPISRYGIFNILSVNSSGVTGSFTAKDNGDGSTSLRVQLTPVVGMNPWGIFNTGDCTNGVPVNTRPIFTLADIENGEKEETIETSTYKSTPGNLIVIIYEIAKDGTQPMVACAELGGPLEEAQAVPPTPTADCTSLSFTSPTLESGTWLAYSAAINGNSDIYILNLDSILHGNPPLIERLTTNPAADFDPTWSPDGAQIAFRSQRDGNDEIYVMNADGTCQRNLTNDPQADWSPAWSPDGKRIAFAHIFDNNPFTDIALINPDGSGLTRLTTGHGEYPAWSPDGTRIAFASTRDGNYEIYVMNADGTDQTRLTNHPAYDMSPTWSPDGTQIVYDTQRDHYPPAETGIGPEFELHTHNIDGLMDVQLTNDLVEDRFPSWGANNWIAYTRNGSLFLIKSDSTDTLKLLDSGNFPAWRP